MLEALVDQLEQVADALAGLDPHDVPDVLKLDWTARTLRVQRRLDGFLAGQLHTIDVGDVTTVECAMTTRAWLVEDQQLSQSEASARLRVARSTVARPAVVEKLRAGEVTHDQAALIVGFLPKLPTADAFVELATLAMNTGELPDTAGEPTQAVVQTSIHDLRRDLEAGDIATSTLDGTPITANTARMLDCDAEIIPAVLAGASEVLDLGRSTRAWTRAQRKTAKIRANGHCEAPRCRAGINRSDLHHEHRWANGGRTDLASATSPEDVPWPTPQRDDG